MKLDSILEEFGLNKKQARVYLACLELGSDTAYRIAKKLRMPRSTCYEVLDDLKERGMVSTFRKKQIKYYSAVDPQSIVTQTEGKIKLLEEALPQFKALYKSAEARPTVRFYQGKTGMKTILNEMLREAKDIRGFSSVEDLFKELGDFWPEHLKARMKKRIPVKVITFESTKARERKRLGPNELREVRIIPSKYAHKGLVGIWGNKIMMFSFEREMVALVIESAILAGTMKAMYAFIWDNIK